MISVPMSAWISSVCIALGLVATANGGTNRWSESGPDVASISRVEFAAGGNSVVFARGGDKFWKSTDAGATWTILQRNNTYDYPFALDRSDPNIVLLAGPSGPLLRSADGGAHFNQVAPIPFFSPYALAFGTDGVAYASVTSTPRVRRSTDRGLTWSTTSQTNLPATGTSSNAIPVPYAIAVDPTDSSRVYLGYRHPDHAGIYRSTDGGANWQGSTGLAGVAVSNIAIDPVTTTRLFVATSVGVYVSNDSGANWARVPDPTGSGVASIDMTSVAIDPSQPQVVYAGGTQQGELFRSTDGGLTWSRRDSGIFASTVTSLALRPGVSGEVLAGTSHTMFRTTDGGANWSPSAHGIKAATVTAVNNGGKLRVGLYDGGIYESDDGTTWTPLNNAGLRARVPTRRLSPVVEIRDAARLFVSLEQDGVFGSTDGGATWLAQPPSFNPLNRYIWGGFIAERGAGPVHYAGTSAGVFKTTNNGDTWVNASLGITMPTIMALAKNTDGTQLFAGTFNGGMFRSTDGGASWIAINTGLTNLEIRSLAYDDSGSNALIVGTNNGLFVTLDGGASYTRLTDPLGAGVQPSIDTILVEDFLRGSLYISYLGRVFRSVDSGQTWTELSTDNPISTFRRIKGLAGDGPGVLYAGATYTGLHQYTVSPEMEIIAQAPPAGTFPVGAQFPWHAQVRNNGPQAATFSRFTWKLGANTSVISPTASRGQCSLASQVLTCDFGVMQAGDAADVDMTVRGISGGPLRIQAAASSAELDLDPSNNTFTDSGVRILEQVDLNAALSASVSTINSGETFEYTLTIRNDGTTLATGAEFETNFDSHDLYSLTAGSDTGCVGAAAGVLRCSLPAIGAGQSISYRWTVTAVPGGPRAASAIVRINPENSSESDTADNFASTTLSVTAANDLSLQLARSAAVVTRDNEFNYVITVTNNGLIPSDGTRARLTLSNLVSYVSAAGAACNVAAGVVTCDIGALAPLASGTVTVTVRALTAGDASAAAQASGANPDPHADNNSASVDVTINNLTPPSSTSSGGGGGAIDYLVLLGLMLAMARRKSLSR
jgi:photosystem II stability/assembly factor-like uncharacterized protein